jgi:hypothetical protein
MKYKQKGFIGILAIIIIAVLGIGGGAYVYKKSENKKLSEETASQATSSIVTTVEKNVSSGPTTIDKTISIVSPNVVGNLDVKANINLQADVTTTVNCGEENCFNKKFANCEPATLTSDVGFASVHYEIISPANGGCKMKMKYPTNPNPEWINKEMTCTFDNKLSLEKSVESTFGGVIEGNIICQGPLFNILTSM